MSKLPLRSQCLDGTGFCTALAQDTLRCILAMAGVIAYLYIHWAHLQAFTTLVALALVAPDTQPREIAHRFQEHRDWTDVLTESSIVLEEESKCDTHEIIEHITSQKQFEHGGVVGLPIKNSTTTRAKERANMMYLMYPSLRRPLRGV